MQTGVVISLATYFLLMLGIGLYAWKKSTADSEGYLLAGRNLSPGVAALSAGASDMSGWLLLGLPGALYATSRSSAASGCSSERWSTGSSSRRACGARPRNWAMP